MLIILLPLDLLRYLRGIHLCLSVLIISQVFLKRPEFFFRLVQLLQTLHWAGTQGTIDVHLPHYLSLQVSIADDKVIRIAGNSIVLSVAGLKPLRGVTLLLLLVVDGVHSTAAALRARSRVIWGDHRGLKLLGGGVGALFQGVQRGDFLLTRGYILRLSCL